MSLFFGKSTGFQSGKNYSSELLAILFLLIFFWILSIWWKRKFGLKSEVEGFTQDSSYILNESAVYDDFYVDIYDFLMLSDERASYTWNVFNKAVQPFSDAVFLDVGSGTGAMVHHVVKSGYRCIGIDSSQAMIKHSSDLYPTDEFINASIMDPMRFERGLFFGVFCLGMTIYEWNDSEKLQFFKNVYFWMRPGGYLLLHLVDVDNFSPVSSTISHDKKRVLDSQLTFEGFSYRNTITINDSSDTDSYSIERETFVDSATGKVRENELKLYLLPLPQLLKLAESSGFIVHAKWNLSSSVYKDKFQYLYLLERAL
jgi:SAM-dependent methyltransferase